MGSILIETAELKTTFGEVEARRQETPRPEPAAVRAPQKSSPDERDLARGAVHADALAGLNAARRRPGPGDGRQTVFPTDDRRMRHHAAYISDGSAYLTEHGSPARRDNPRDQDFSLLQ